MSLLEEDITRKRRVDKNFRQINFNIANNEGEKYEVEAIRNTAFYTKESVSHLLGLYYLIS